MNDILKQRLVGALVLIALGVVFWPVVFVDSERGGLDRSSQVPAMPSLEKMQLESPRPMPAVAPAELPGDIALHDSPPEALEDISETVQQRTAEAAPEPPAENPPPALDEQGIPIAWVLQVVSVSTREKADELTKELVADGYKAYNRPLRRDGNVLFRVYVGPVFERSKLQEVKRVVDRRLEVDALIVRYVP